MYPKDYYVVRKKKASMYSKNERGKNEKRVKVSFLSLITKTEESTPVSELITFKKITLALRNKIL